MTSEILVDALPYFDTGFDDSAREMVTFDFISGEIENNLIFYVLGSCISRRRMPTNKKDE